MEQTRDDDLFFVIPHRTRWYHRDKAGIVRNAGVLDSSYKIPHTVIHHQQDIRTSGRYLMAVRDPAKGVVYWGQGVYREVKPPEKIVFTWCWTESRADGSQLHPESPETQVTVEFFARGNSTELVLTHVTFGSKKDRDEHDQGWNACLDLLATVLQTTMGTPSR